MNKAQSPDEGFTLLEVIIATLLLTGVIAVSFNIFVMSRRIVVLDAQRQAAASFAVDTIEKLKGEHSFYAPILIDASGGSNGTTYPVGLPDGDFKDKYAGTCQYKVTDITSGGSIAYKKLEVTVNWKKPAL